MKLAYAGIAAGTLYLWSGLKGWSLTGTLADIASGRAPSGRQVNPIRGGIPSGGSTETDLSVGGGTSTIANDALNYRGHAYLYGGAPGRTGAQPWDCSSFVNWVVGHDEGLSIPGYPNGSYDGTVHGPPTGSWAAWPGLRRIPREQVQAGDIIVWALHMGIAISNSQMISAQDPADGTKVGPIDGGGNGPLLKYGRL